MKQDTYQDYEPGYKTNNLEYLYDWLFHYNPYTDLYAAVPRHLINEYFNNYNCEGVLRSRTESTLREILHRAGGDINKIDV